MLMFHYHTPTSHMTCHVSSLSDFMFATSLLWTRK